MYLFCFIFDYQGGVFATFYYDDSLTFKTFLMRTDVNTGIRSCEIMFGNWGLN